MESIPEDEELLRDIIMSEDLLKSSTEFIGKYLPDSKLDSNEELGKMQDSLYCVLKVLEGQCNGHINSQKFMLESSWVIDRIYKLSIAKLEKKSIGLQAELVIEVLSKESDNVNEPTKAYVGRLIQKTKDHKKKLAAAKKAEIMGKMKMSSQAKPNLQMFGIEKFEEEKGMQCIVCHEGYAYKPKELLGVYVYTKPFMIKEEDFECPNKNTIGYSSVTHFNTIHLSCHGNAHRAEQSNRQPKGEWEGATIRNSHTKCNNWMPIRGGEVTSEAFIQAINKFFHNQNNIHKTTEEPFRLVIHNIKFLLRKFAYQESFSHYSKGGGPLHNMQLIPFLLQIALSLMTQKTQNLIGIIEKFREKGKALSAILEKEKIIVKGKSIEDKLNKLESNLELNVDDFIYAGSLGLLIEQKEWESLRYQFVQTAVGIATQLRQIGATVEIKGKKEEERQGLLLYNHEETKLNQGQEEVLKEIRPLLILVSIVDKFRLQIINAMPTNQDYHLELDNLLLNQHIKVYYIYIYIYT